MADLTVLEISLVLSMGKGYIAAFAAFQLNMFGTLILGCHTAGRHSACQQGGNQYQQQDEFSFHIR